MALEWINGHLNKGSLFSAHLPDMYTFNSLAQLAARQ
jgi:hypothetical protein